MGGVSVRGKCLPIAGRKAEGRGRRTEGGGGGGARGTLTPSLGRRRLWRSLSKLVWLIRMSGLPPPSLSGARQHSSGSHTALETPMFICTLDP